LTPPLIRPVSFNRTRPRSVRGQTKERDITMSSTNTKTGQTYTAYYSKDGEYALHDFQADSPEQALELARELYEQNPCPLEFNSCNITSPLDYIKISDAENNRLVFWESDDMRLHQAAEELLEALEAARVALNTAPRFKVPTLGCDSYQIAARCDAVIAKARPSAS
jgi:hypothetical protein